MFIVWTAVWLHRSDVGIRVDSICVCLVRGDFGDKVRQLSSMPYKCDCGLEIEWIYAHWLNSISMMWWSFEARVQLKFWCLLSEGNWLWMLSLVWIKFNSIKMIRFTSSRLHKIQFIVLSEFLNFPTQSREPSENDFICEHSLGTFRL